jgi:transposase-like protein
MHKNKQCKADIYAVDLKISVAREYLSSDLSFGKLSVKYGYPVDTLRHFVRWYKSHYPQGHEVVEPPVIPSPADKDMSRQLADAHLKIAAYEMLIQNAGKELGVDIIKKLGTRPPVS